MNYVKGKIAHHHTETRICVTLPNFPGLSSFFASNHCISIIWKYGPITANQSLLSAFLCFTGCSISCLGSYPSIMTASSADTTPEWVNSTRPTSRPGMFLSTIRNTQRKICLVVQSVRFNDIKLCFRKIRCSPPVFTGKGGKTDVVCHVDGKIGCSQLATLTLKEFTQATNETIIAKISSFVDNTN